MAYTSLVRSPMEYCGAIWDPVLKRDVDKLERVQRQGARWAKGVHGIVSVSGILRELSWLRSWRHGGRSRDLPCSIKYSTEKWPSPMMQGTSSTCRDREATAWPLLGPVLVSPHHHFGIGVNINERKSGTARTKKREKR